MAAGASGSASLAALSPLGRGAAEPLRGPPGLRESRFYEDEFPSTRDIVVIQVARVEELAMGVYATLLEYGGKVGMLLIGEATARLSRNMVSKTVRKGRIMVCMVLQVGNGCIDLSKRRVSPELAQAKEQAYVKAKAVHSIMWNVARRNKVDLEDLCKKVSWPLFKKYGDAYDALKRHVNGEIDLWKEQPQREIVCVADRSDGSALGVDVELRRDHLLITDIKKETDIEKEEGAVAKWNRANPNAQVLVGDRIVEVNEVRGNDEDMNNECKLPKVLNLKLLQDCEMPNLSDKLKKDIEACFRRHLGQQKVHLRAKVEVSYSGYEGIDVVREALAKGFEASKPECELKINLLAHPIFVISCTCSDKALGVATIDAAMELIERSIKASGGAYRMRSHPELAGGQDLFFSDEEDEDLDEEEGNASEEGEGATGAEGEGGRGSSSGGQAAG